jgi:hypothetical protein
MREQLAIVAKCSKKNRPVFFSPHQALPDFKLAGDEV